MSGRLNIAVSGQQDIWVIGNPSFSHFLMSFKRHTKFAIEAIETPFTGNMVFGGNIICRIPQNKGDLIKSVILNITLEKGGNNYIESIGSKIIDHIDLVIGGQTIERMTGEYIYMHTQLNHDYDDTQKTLYYTSGHNGTISKNEFNYRLYIPFYFHKHPELFIPVFAIKKQIVEIHIKFKRLDQVASVVDNDFKIKNTTLISDFIFLDALEKNILTNTVIQQLITQVQVAKVYFNNTNKKSFLVNFKNPVKEMFFIALENLSHKFINRVEMRVNNNILFDKDKLLLTYHEPMTYYKGYITDTFPFGVHSFSLRPHDLSPSGQVNMSRIAHKLITIELDNVINGTVHVYAVSYNILQINAGLVGLKF